MKILICDDDISVINVIEKQIDWTSLDIDTILRAYNGTVAKEIIEAERPNLILCDIEMPQSDGISVLKYVYNSGIPTEFMFLTCYESFEYAREAVRYGAKNYLTKPLDLKELYEALQTMVASAWKKTAEANRDAESKNREAASTNQVLSSLKDGICGTDEKKINEVLEQEHFPYRAESLWRILCLSADMTKGLDSGWDKGMMRYGLRSIAQEEIADRSDFSYLLVDSGEKLEYLLQFVPAEKYTENELESRCRRFIRVCEKQMNVSPVCLIGDVIRLSQTAEIYPRIRRRAKKLHLSYGKVFLLRDTDTQNAEDAMEVSADTSLDEKTILQYLKLQQKEKFVESVDKSVQAIIKKGKNTEQKLDQMHQDLLQTFYSCLRDNHIQAHVLFQDETLRELDENAERTGEDMISFASYLFEKSSEALHVFDESSDVIGSVKKYISEHFKEDIDRNGIASVAFITPNYLSKRFRIEIGMSLREYINQLRIEEAKRLLLSTNLSVSDIAVEVGYDNISYFSTVFRKLCGVSPVDWRG
jgi:two-component system response regulator YesN